MTRRLRAALDAAVRSERLTVVADLDGTLAPIVADPAAIRPSPLGLAALGSLARSPGVRVVVLSGRPSPDLASHVRVEGVELAGEHGVGSQLPDAAAARDLDRFVSTFVTPAVALAPGARMERKSAGVAVHARGVARGGDALLELLGTRAARERHLHVMPGKAVLEISALPYDKGQALQRRRDDAPVVMLGDDVTDETVFAVLRPGDVGIKVGPGATLADHRVASPRAAARWLARLAARRQARRS